MAGSELGEWDPLDVLEAAALLGSLPLPWWIAGGQALDLFIGRSTREHGDLDVEVLRRDQLALQEALAGWDLRIALDGKLAPWPRGEVLPEGSTSIWARRDGAGGWEAQFYFADASADLWVYRRDARVTRPIATIGLHSGAGVPYLAPEIQLLYNAKSSQPKAKADFGTLRPRLSRKRQAWLAEALTVAHPGHRWLAWLTP